MNKNPNNIHYYEMSRSLQQSLSHFISGLCAYIWSILDSNAADMSTEIRERETVELNSSTLPTKRIIFIYTRTLCKKFETRNRWRWTTWLKKIVASIFGRFCRCPLQRFTTFRISTLLFYSHFAQSAIFQLVGLDEISRMEGGLGLGLSLNGLRIEWYSGLRSRARHKVIIHNICIYLCIYVYIGI